MLFCNNRVATLCTTQFDKNRHRTFYNSDEGRTTRLQVLNVNP